MGKVTLRPNGTRFNEGWGAISVSGAGAATVSSDANDLWRYTSDNNALTYVESPIGNGGTLSLFYGTFAFPARSQIRSVTPRFDANVIKEQDGLSRIAYRPWVLATPHPTLSSVLLSAGRKAYAGAAYTTNPAGNRWTPADIDGIRLHVARRYTDDRDRPIIYEQFLDVEYNEAPVITLTAPAASVTETSTPTIDGTYSDPENDPMERAHWGVWPESVYSTWPAGFVPTLHIDPARRTPGWVWYEGPVLTSSLARRVTTPLPNGNYRVYAAAADAGSEARYSATVMRQWAQNVPGPPPPTVTASVDVANARIALPATASASTPSTEFLRWETLVAGQWIGLRGYERVAATPGSTVVAYDYEARPGEATQYRVRAGRVIAGADVVSATVTVQATQTLDSWWLKDPFNPALRLRVECYRGKGDTEWDLVSSEAQAVFPVLGARYDVTIGGPIKGEEFDATFTLYGPAQRAAFEALRNPGRILLLQNPKGEGDEAQWYIRFGADRSKAKLVTSSNQPVWRSTVECRERGRP